MVVGVICDCTESREKVVRPCIAEAFHVEEGLVRLRLCLFERPENCAVGWLVDGAIHDDWNPHVRVCLQTEGHDRHADEEHRNHSHHLQRERKNQHGPAVISQRVYFIKHESYGSDLVAGGIYGILQQLSYAFR